MNALTVSVNNRPEAVAAGAPDDDGTLQASLSCRCCCCLLTADITCDVTAAAADAGGGGGM